jgi:hypothetical protein
MFQANVERLGKAPVHYKLKRGEELSAGVRRVARSIAANGLEAGLVDVCKERRGV